jgi:hypothetical protein
MGIQVDTSFETPQGFNVTQVYVRIARASLINSTQVQVYLEAFLSREKRLANASSLTVPGLPNWTSFPAPSSDMTRTDLLYPLIHQDLAFRGFVCTPVLEPPTPEVSQQSSESTPPTLPTPPPPEEPPAASPEPQPQPSSEYAPAPAETEA